MADIQHENIADPKIHEPKGASTASVNTVYVSDGAGSGAWEKIDSDSADMTSLKADVQTDLTSGALTVPGKFYVTAKLADVSTAGSVIIPILKSCTVTKATVVLGGAITVADAAVSFKNAAAASMGTDVTVAFTASAKGSQFAFTATGNNVITAPSWIEVATDGGSTDAQELYITVEMTYNVNS